MRIRKPYTVAAGHATKNPSVAVSFPSGSDTASQLARIDAALVTLQNLNGPGQGCPASSTTFSAQQAAILAQGSAAAATPAVAAAPPATSASPPAASASPPAATSDAGGVNVALVPQFGVTADTNPDGKSAAPPILILESKVDKINRHRQLRRCQWTEWAAYIDSLRMPSRQGHVHRESECKRCR